MRTISYHPSVPLEVREILDYYEGISGILADDFWAELTEGIRAGISNPPSL